ncbi:sugar transport protein 8-like [Panicum miliaceum]|uniref:Sugar transport protein 8-like n=1 Tax=Panicum miliaceum TaxID=4540 RepID=A0A3L6T6Y5_PANMI|nr:sugar transport protein 8-like [Panicum miliaceum]
MATRAAWPLPRPVLFPMTTPVLRPADALLALAIAVAMLIISRIFLGVGDAVALNAEEQPYRRLLRPESRPPLVIAVAMLVFQQFTGVNAIMFYAPVLFQTMGFDADGSLLSAVVTGGVNVASTFVSIVLVDKVGRRKLLLEACAQMLIAQMAIGGIMSAHVKADSSPSSAWAVAIVVLHYLQDVR